MSVYICARSVKTQLEFFLSYSVLLADYSQQFPSNAVLLDRSTDQWKCCVELRESAYSARHSIHNVLNISLQVSGKQNFFSIVLIELIFSAKTSKSRRTCDIISMLVNVYGSKELFVNEYRTLLADRLLSQFTYNTEKEIRYLELLKIRYAINITFHSRSCIEKNST